MRVAVQNPMMTAGYGGIGIHDYVLRFIERYQPVIYLSSPRLLWQWFSMVQNNHWRARDFRVVWSADKLNALADVLLSFTGEPHHPQKRMPRGFHGTKIMHSMDYMYQPKESYSALQEDGVTYLFGYARHDVHCDFFKTHYPAYVGKVLPVPFGFAPRFVNNKPFAERRKKAVALGSINLFGGRMDGTRFGEAVDYFLLKRGEPFMHKFRRMLVDREQDIASVCETERLPHYPRESDFQYDLVAELNDYQLFTCCESLFYFPAAKTFEGPAAGSVLVCSDHPVFDDFGFEDGVNCIKHKQFDVDDFKRVVQTALSDPDQLATIARAGERFVREHYTHTAIARNIVQQLSNLSPNV